jgi:hypothetical protein
VIVELQPFVPKLLLCGGEDERVAALPAGALFVNVKVSWDVVAATENLGRYIAGNAACGTFGL